VSPGAGTLPKPVVLYATLALLFLVCTAYRTRDTLDRIVEMRHGHTLAQLPFNVDLPGFEISGLIEAVQPIGGRPAQDLIAALMRAADAFVATAPQHDDMTLVVARVLS
jgi:hypothetical protein